MKARKGGAGKCASCTHPQQAEINADLISGQSMNSLSKKWGISDTSLAAHKRNHISAGLKAVKAGKDGKGLRAKDRLETMISTCENLLKWAQGMQDANGNFQVLPNVGQALSAVRELRATIELLARITGELDDRPTTVINVLQTPAWRETTVLLYKALSPFPDARIAVSKVLEGTYRELPARQEVDDSRVEPNA